jgi:putative membrane protein
VSETEQLDVDVRFLLANERTMLAWVRTALAIEAGGLALLQLQRHHAYIGIFVLAIGAGVSFIGFHRYKATDQAIRAHHLPHAGHGPAVQVGIVVGVALLLAIAQLTILN